MEVKEQSQEVKKEPQQSEQAQLKQLKLNVTNIKSILIKKNQNTKKSDKKEDDQEKKKLSVKKKKEEEKKLTAGASSLKRMASSVKGALAKPGGSLFDKMMDFGLIVLTGILVNALPAIKKKLEDIFTAVGKFITPVVDTIQILINAVSNTDGKVSPELEEKQIKFRQSIETAKDNLLEGIRTKLGPLGSLVDALKPLIDNLTSKFGAKLKLQTGGATLTINEEGEEGLTTAEGNFVRADFSIDQRRRYDKGDRKAYIMPAETPKGSTEDAAASAAAAAASAAAAGIESSNDPSTGPLDPAHGAGPSNPQSKTGFVAGKGNAGKRIFLHWSAGSHTTAYSAYHSIALGDGSMVRHTPYSQDKGTHTGGANTDSVGLAIAAAAGAQERGKFGQYAPTKAQLDAMIYDAAKLAAEWGWSEGTIDSNVRTHGEWERYATRNGILDGSPQRWDLDRLRDSDPLIDASKVLSGGGNELRQRIKATFRLIKQQSKTSSSTTLTSANITPTGNQTITANVISQSSDNEGEIIVAIQPIVYTA
jgi:hypothetical protein